MTGIFEGIIGYEDVKLELERIIDTIRNKEKYNAIGAKTPAGVLLHGNPGIGKTVLSLAFLKATGRKSFILRKSKPNGEFVNEIKETFEKAKAGEPCVILLDDMDKFANEDDHCRDAEEYVTVQSCIDEIRGKDIFIIATANEIHKLPRSLTRAGRFDKVIELHYPEGEDATKIIRHYLKDKKTVDEVDAGEISRILEGNSCAELESVINEAGILAAFDGKEKIEREHIIRAAMRVIFNAPESLAPIKECDLRSTAVHEAGHTLVAELLEPGCVNLVSVNRHSGRTLGFTSYKNNESYFFNIKYMENRVIAILGGKAATELVYGAPDVGCNSDMHRAFDIVERFVDNYCRYGFDKFERNNSSNVLLAKKESFIHAELDRFYARAKELLSSNRHLLDSLTDALVSRKTLASGDVAKLCASARCVAQ